MRRYQSFQDVWGHTKKSNSGNVHSVSDKSSKNIAIPLQSEVASLQTTVQQDVPKSSDPALDLIKSMQDKYDNLETMLNTFLQEQKYKAAREDQQQKEREQRRHAEEHHRHSHATQHEGILLPKWLIYTCAVALVILLAYSFYSSSYTYKLENLLQQQSRNVIRAQPNSYAYNAFPF
jgi:hypothetical protein